MYTATYVEAKMASWKKKKLTIAEFCVKTATACMGWSYVYGARGQYCTPAFRKQRANASKAEAAVIIGNCQVLSGKKSACDGCKWFPGGKTRCYDCRGFTYWVLYQAGINIEGQGATSQWNTKKNWSAQGEIRDMPTDTVCCVFMKKGSKMSHTGLYVGNGTIIHCSGTVKKGLVTDKGWTHYAVPAGMSGTVPGGKPTLAKGDRGEYVTLMQTKLIQLGYDVGRSGADGKFGANTEDALKKFQQDSGIPATGVCDDATWDALESGKTTLYTVTVQHVSKSVADGIIKTYGGTMKAEG